MKKKLKKVIWGIVLAVVLLGAAFLGGAVWQDKYQPTQIVVNPVSPAPTVPPSDGQQGFDELAARVTNLEESVSTQPVTVTVNPVVNVNPVITVTVSDNDTATQPPCPKPVVPPTAHPCGIQVERLEGLVYAGNFNDYEGTIRPAAGECEWLEQNWGSSGPFGLTRFSTKWFIDVTVLCDGYYQFEVVADDQVRLSVNDKCRIDNGTSLPQPITSYTATVYLKAGSHKVVLKYFNSVVGNSYLKLSCHKIR